MHLLKIVLKTRQAADKPLVPSIVGPNRAQQGNHQEIARSTHFEIFLRRGAPNLVSGNLAASARATLHSQSGLGSPHVFVTEPELEFPEKSIN